MAQQLEKAVRLYASKYSMNIDSFINFLNEKMDCIKEKINQYNASQPLTKEDIIFYLHCVSAVQKKGSITDFSDERVRKYLKINFKTSKKNKGSIAQKESQKSEANQTISQIMSVDQNQDEEQPRYQEKQKTKMRKKDMVPQYQQVQNDQHQVVIKQNIAFKKSSDENSSPTTKGQRQYTSIIKSPDFKQMHEIKEQSGTYRTSMSQSDDIYNPYQEVNEDQDQGAYMQPYDPNEKGQTDQTYEGGKVIQQSSNKKQKQQSSEKQKGKNQSYYQQKSVQQQRRVNQQKKKQVNEDKKLGNDRSKVTKIQKIVIPEQQIKRRKNSYNDKDSPRTINEIRKAKGLGQGSNQMNIISMGDTSQYNMDSTVSIIQYEKVNQDFINVVIKYQVVYNDFKVWRRYSDFEKLMKHLNKKYEGAILPEMPPKQGIKANLSYFWGPDEQFLRQRKQKLQLLLKRLITSKFVYRDQTLNKFLTHQAFEVDSEADGMSFSLSSIRDIALSLNAKEIKDYGIAYYKYMKQSKLKLNQNIQSLHQEIQKMVQRFSSINDYRIKINQNFKKRKDLLREAGFTSNKKQGSQFDRLIKQTHEQINDLKAEFKRYENLKYEQSWLSMLSQQKEDKTEYQQKGAQLKERIKKMEINLQQSMRQFKESKSKLLAQIGDKMYYWRSKIHP